MKNSHLLLSLILSTLLTGCTSTADAPPVAQAKHANTPVPTPTPLSQPMPTPSKAELAAEPTPESRSVQAMIQKWRTAGLNATALYQSSPNTIQWTVLRTTLPINAKQADEIVSEVARFAKLSSRPVQLLLVTTHQKDDIRLSKVIKDAAQKSGGKNNVKFDHVIETRAQALIQLQLRESK